MSGPFDNQDEAATPLSEEEPSYVHRTSTK